MVAPEGSSTSEELQTMESLGRSLASGRYRIMRILGAGAMGSVRLAEDTALHRRVAIKTVKDEVARNPEIRRRIERECLLHAKVGPHPNIVTLFDKLEADDEMHLVMEYIDGETLQARLERNSEMGIVMPPSESILIASQVLDALSRIHAQQIVHRDIKPANIMLTYNESGSVCSKLMDFGISRFAEDVWRGVVRDGRLRDGCDVVSVAVGQAAVSRDLDGGVERTPEHADPAYHGEDGRGVTGDDRRVVETRTGEKDGGSHSECEGVSRRVDRADGCWRYDEPVERDGAAWRFRVERKCADDSVGTETHDDADVLRRGQYDDAACAVSSQQDSAWFGRGLCVDRDCIVSVALDWAR